MVIRSIRVAATTAAVFIAGVAMAPAAMAGETTGNGDETPVGKYEVPASICAFSGLNDVPDGSDAPWDPFAAGKIQSWGDILQEVAKMEPGTVPTMKDLMQAMKPGISCNKNRALPH